jgi:hypothetical protein
MVYPKNVRWEQTVDREVIDGYLLDESRAGRWALQHGCIQTIQFEAERPQN